MSYYRGKSPAARARTPNPAEGTGIDAVFVPLPPKNSLARMQLFKEKKPVNPYSSEQAIPNRDRSPVQMSNSKLDFQSPSVPRAPRSPAAHRDERGPSQQSQKSFNSRQIQPSVGEDGIKKRGRPPGSVNKQKDDHPGRPFHPGRYEQISQEIEEHWRVVEEKIRRIKKVQTLMKDKMDACQAE